MQHPSPIFHTAFAGSTITFFDVRLGRMVYNAPPKVVMNCHGRHSFTTKQWKRVLKRAAAAQ